MKLSIAPSILARSALTLTLLFTLSFVLFLIPPAQAKGLNLYAAASTGYTLGSLRVGLGDWEAGLLAPDVLGASKVMSFRENYYVGLGFTANLIGSVSPGFMGAIGFNYNLFWSLGLRGEFYAVQGTNGFSRGGLLLGLSLNF